MSAIHMSVWKHADVLMHAILCRQHHDRIVRHHTKVAVEALKQRLSVVLLRSHLNNTGIITQNIARNKMR